MNNEEKCPIEQININKKIEAIRYCRSTAKRLAVELDQLGYSESAMDAARIMQSMDHAARGMEKL